MALEHSILHCKHFFFFLLLLLRISSSSSSSSSVANDTASSATSFNFEISGEHSMEDPSSFSAAAAPHAAIPYVRVSVSFSISGLAPSAAAVSDDRAAAAAAEMEKMLGDAAASLSGSGRYIVVAAAIRAHLDELAPLRKVTILAPDDRAIADALYYESPPPRFHLHVVPDRLLTYPDLRRLPVGAELPTLDPGESLVLTSNGGGRGAPDIVRLNFVTINAPDLIIGSRIAVHGLRLPISEFDLWDIRTSPRPSSTSSPSSLAALI